MSQEIKKLQRKLNIQKRQYEGTISGIREEYELQINGLQQQRDIHEDLLSKRCYRM